MVMRKLKEKDAMLMMEWMHDFDVVQHMHTDFMSKTIEDCKQFISDSRDGGKNIHFAIVDSNDTYMGTVSLKNIDYEEKNAEMGITVRKEAMGKGVAKEALAEIVLYAFNQLGLRCVYWCVSKNNQRALKFYDKNGYQRIQYEKMGICTPYDEQEINSYVWYSTEKSDLT